jgi:hypothetical protein
MLQSIAKSALDLDALGSSRARQLYLRGPETVKIQLSCHCPAETRARRSPTVIPSRDAANLKNMGGRPGRKMAATLRRKKWWFSSVKMVSTGHHSAKRHCLHPLCGRETVKFRWGSVACSGRSGRGECGLFRLYCCAFAVLNISMGVLTGQVQVTMLVDDSLTTRTGTAFLRWMPLPMQNRIPGCALDKKHLHALLERGVIIPYRHCVFWCPPIDEMRIANPGQRQPTCNDLWAPDPGRVPDIGLLHQFLASSNTPTITIAGDSVQTDEHTPGSMQSMQ